MNAPKLSSATAFEGWLEDKGFSRSRAKAITAKGFRAGDMEASEANEIAAMVQKLASSRQLITKRRRTDKPSIGDIVRNFATALWRLAAEEVNQITVEPGGKGYARIQPVSPGLVTFAIDPPRDMPDAKFKCKIRYFKVVDNNRVVPAWAVLTHNNLSEQVDRGVLKAASVPVPSVRSVEEYFSDLVVNMFKGATQATLDFFAYPQGHPLSENFKEGTFKLTVINHKIDNFKLERAIEAYRRRHPDQFDPE